MRTTDIVMIATQNQPHMSDTGPPLLYAMEKEPAQGSIISPSLSAVSHGGAARRSVRKSTERAWHCEGVATDIKCLLVMLCRKSYAPLSQKHGSSTDSCHSPL